MDVVLLSRIQFAVTIMFHYLFPPLTIGMGVVLVYILHAVENFHDAPWMIAVVLLNVLSIANIPRALFRGSPGQSFLSSSASILVLAYTIIVYWTFRRRVQLEHEGY